MDSDNQLLDQALDDLTNNLGNVTLKVNEQEAQPEIEIQKDPIVDVTVIPTSIQANTEKNELEEVSLSQVTAALEVVKNIEQEPENLQLEKNDVKNEEMEIERSQPIATPTLPERKDKYAEARAAYVNKILNPVKENGEVDEVAVKKLKEKLALQYSDLKINLKNIIPEVKELIEKQKLEKFVKELEADFNERMELISQTDFVLNEHADANFKPQTSKSLIGNIMLYGETEEAKSEREQKEYKQGRKQFIKDNREKCLLEALRAEIRYPQKDGLSVAEINQLDKEEKAQKLIETPRYQSLVGGHLDKKAKLSPQDFKKNSDLLSVSMQAKIKAELDASLCFNENAMGQKPITRTVMFKQFQSALASAKNNVLDEIEVKAGRKKGFKSLV